MGAGAGKRRVGSMGSGAGLLPCPLPSVCPPHRAPLGEIKGKLLVGTGEGYSGDFSEGTPQASHRTPGPCPLWGRRRHWLRGGAGSVGMLVQIPKSSPAISLEPHGPKPNPHLREWPARSQTKPRCWAQGPCGAPGAQQSEGTMRPDPGSGVAAAWGAGVPGGPGAQHCRVGRRRRGSA